VEIAGRKLRKSEGKNGKHAELPGYHGKDDNIASGAEAASNSQHKRRCRLKVQWKI